MDQVHPWCYIDASPYPWLCWTDLGASGDSVSVVQTTSLSGKFSGIDTKRTLYEVRVERGLSWEEAENVMLSNMDSNYGFFVSTQVRRRIVESKICFKM